MFLQVLFSHINLYGNISAIGLPFAFIKLYLGSNVFAVVGFYFLSKLYLFGKLKWILITSYEIVFLTLYHFANEYIKKDKKLFVLELFLVLSNVLLLYFSFESKEKFIYFLINFVLELILLIFFFKFDLTYKNKLVFYKFSKQDYFVFACMVLLLSLGVFSFKFLYVKFAIFIIVLLNLIFVKILPVDRFFISVIIFSLGGVISSGEFLIFEIAVIFSLCVLIFKEFNKWFYLTLSAISVAIILIIFNIFDIFCIISIFFAFFIYMFIPKKVIEFLSGIFDTDAVSIIFRRSQEIKIDNLKKKLNLMANTLLDMQTGFKFLVVGKIDREKACAELSNDVIKKCCNECENFRFCFMENINKKTMFENMLLKAIENKQFYSSDLTSSIQTYCHRSGIVAGEISQMAKLFLSYESAMKSQDESKLLISSELENFSNIFKNFAKTIKNNEKFNAKLSKNIKENAINLNVDIKEAMIFECETGIDRVDVIVSNEQALKKELKEAVSKTIKNKVMLSCVQHLAKSGFSLASFKIEPKIKIEFTIASKAKDKINGDSKVVSKLQDNVYFVAIADGMGHGDEAAKFSAMVLNLIKSMFEVGLDYMLVIDSINKLLIPAGAGKFTTLDACVIDLNKNECLFIKLGSSVSILKHADGSELISCSSLPIGVVKNVSPTVIKKQIYQGDMIFLASDGIVDSFLNIENFKTFVNDSKIYNMQRFLDNVVFDAEIQNQAHLDDMTIIGINLLKN